MRTPFLLAALLALALVLPAVSATHTPCTNEAPPMDVHYEDFVGVDTGYPTQGSVTVCVGEAAVALNSHADVEPFGTTTATVSPAFCNGFTCLPILEETGVETVFAYPTLHVYVLYDGDIAADAHIPLP